MLEGIMNNEGHLETQMRVRAANLQASNELRGQIALKLQEE